MNIVFPWAPDDERGALNLIDAAATLRGVASVRDGVVVPLGLPIEGGSRGAAVPIRPTVQHFMTRNSIDYPQESHGFGFSDDVIMLATHGTTHIDALAHVWQDGVMYNGYEAASITSRGAKKCGIDKAGPFVTRAIFVDLVPEGAVALEPGAAIDRDALVAAIEKGGVEPRPGDALLVRTGWIDLWRLGKSDSKVSAGLHHNCADWLVQSGFALIGADNIAVEALPSRDAGCAVPLHIALTRDRGIYLAELFDLTALARFKRAAFLLVISPLPIKGGVGSPINPVAIL